MIRVAVKRAIIAPILAVAFGLCAALSVAGGAPPAIPLQSWLDFAHSLNAKKGVYYLLSPEIVLRQGVETGLKRRQLSGDYVIVYGRNENIAKREELATEDMAIIRAHLHAAFGRPDNSVMGTAVFHSIGVENIFDSVSLSCHMRFSNWPRGLTLSAVGENVSWEQYCVGFGAMMGLAGYRIAPAKDDFEFKRVFGAKSKAYPSG